MAPPNATGLTTLMYPLVPSNWTAPVLRLVYVYPPYAVPVQLPTLSITTAPNA